MATFVLVHGGMYGGWQWAGVRALLREAGHDVYTPTVTGAGERVHLGGPHVTLDTHVQDVANVLVYEDLREVALVGHSYGGMVVTGVASRLAERVARIVYVDAAVPHDGEALADLLAADHAQRLWDHARRSPGVWRMELPSSAPARATGALVRTYLEPIRLHQPSPDLARVFVHCTNPRTASVDASAGRARAAGWPFFELPCGHDAPGLMPRELTDLLLKTVGATSGSTAPAGSTRTRPLSSQETG